MYGYDSRVTLAKQVERSEWAREWDSKSIQVHIYVNNITAVCDLNIKEENQKPSTNTGFGSRHTQNCA